MFLVVTEIGGLMNGMFMLHACKVCVRTYVCVCACLAVRKNLLKTQFFVHINISLYMFSTPLA